MENAHRGIGCFDAILRGDLLRSIDRLISENFCVPVPRAEF
jgi:hypothetical protein